MTDQELSEHRGIPPVDAETDEGVHCKAIAESTGRCCARPHVPDSDYCWQHRGSRS